MKTSVAITCLILSAALAPVAAYSATETQKATTYVKDSAITAKIKAKLAGEKMSSLARINVDTDAGGNVMLSGDAKSREEIDKAVTIARGTEGVASVQNTVVVKP